MEDENNNSVKTILWIVGIIFFVWLIFFSDNSSRPERITEEFENGNSIDMEVDRSITSDNWECTSDCSGHDAGYEWAEENGISDPSDCGGKSESFIEGCEAYANENY